MEYSEAPLKRTLLGSPLCVWYLYFKGFPYSSGGHGNVCSGWRGCIFEPFCCRTRLRNDEGQCFYNALPLNLPNVVHNFMKAVDVRLDYGVNFVQLKYCWDWRTCLLYRIQSFPHFRSFDYTQTYVCKCILDQTKCPQYCRWPLFQGCP